MLTILWWLLLGHLSRVVRRSLSTNLLNQPHVALCEVLGSHYWLKAINNGLVFILGCLADYEILIDLQCGFLRQNIILVR